MLPTVASTITASGQMHSFIVQEKCT